MFLTLNHCFQLKYDSSVHNNVFSREKVVSSESGEKYAQIKQCFFLFIFFFQMKHWILMWEDNRGWAFSPEDVLLLIMELYFGQKWPFNVRSMDLFLRNPQLLTWQDVNWWTGVVWITCGLLWWFYQLFGLSFWRHPFTAEDPLVSKWCNSKFLQICSHEETISSPSWMAWGWVHLQQIL